MLLKQEISKKTKQINKRKWTKQESSKLLKLVEKFGEKWTKISGLMNDRNPKQCIQKYLHLVKVKKKGYWSRNEDEIVKNWVTKNGPNKWSECAKLVNGRCGKQCRERYMNFLDANLKKGKWSDTESDKMYFLMKKYLCSWAEISKNITRRSENSVKNFFYTSIKLIKKNGVYPYLISFIYNNNEKMDESISDPVNNFIDNFYDLNRLSQRIVSFVVSSYKNEFGEFRKIIFEYLFNNENLNNSNNLHKDNNVISNIRDRLELFILECLGEEKEYSCLSSDESSEMNDSNDNNEIESKFKKVKSENKMEISIFPLKPKFTSFIQNNQEMIKIKIPFEDKFYSMNVHPCIIKQMKK